MEGDFFILKNDGTVEFTDGSSIKFSKELESWKDIVCIRVGYDYLIGVTADGNVKTFKYSDAMDVDINLDDWNNIIQIEPCLDGGIVGLKDDGTIVYKGVKKNNILDIKEWKDIVQLSGTMSFLVGLKKDGTVVVTTQGNNYLDELKKEKNVIQLSQNEYFADMISVIKDGGRVNTYVNAYNNKYDTSSWKDVVCVYNMSYNVAYGIKRDGTIAVPESYDGYTDSAAYWTGIKTYEEWRSMR